MPKPKVESGIIAVREASRRDKLLECTRPVTHRMFPRGIHFAKRLMHPFRNEDRIVTEALVATRRKFEMAFHFAPEHVRSPIWLGKRERAYEFRRKTLCVPCL